MANYRALAVLPAIIAVCCVAVAAFLIWKRQDDGGGYWVPKYPKKVPQGPQPPKPRGAKLKQVIEERLQTGNGGLQSPPKLALPVMTPTCVDDVERVKIDPRLEMIPEVTENHKRETKVWRYRVWSENRDHTVFPSPSRYKITLPKQLRNVTGVAIHNATIPNTEYVVGPHNQHLDIDEGGTTYDVVLPQGDYHEGADFATALETAIQGVGLVAYTVTFSTLTSTLTINSNGAGFSLLFGSGDNVNNSLWRQMGFLRTDTGDASSHTSDGVVDLSGVKTVDVKIEELDCDMEGQPIASIDLTPGSPYTIYTLEPDDRRFFPVGKLKTLTITLSTNHSKIVEGEVVDASRLYETNGVDNNIWLEFYMLHYRNTLNDEIELDPTS